MRSGSHAGDQGTRTPRLAGVRRRPAVATHTMAVMNPAAVPDPPAQARRARRVWWWFLIPLLTFGFGTFVSVLIGGVTRRSRPHIAAAFGYLLLTIYTFAGMLYTPSEGGSLPDAAVIPAFILCWVGGVAHTVVLQMLVSGSAVPAGDPGTDPALAAALLRRRHREQARAILARDPALAVDLRIGRPDLPGRSYEDGGLIDVNHVPAQLLSSELELPASLAASIVAARETVAGGFSSPDELIVYCEGMTPERLRVIRDRLVFLPR